LNRDNKITLLNIINAISTVMWSQTLVLLQTGLRPTKFGLGIGLSLGNLGVEEFQGAFDGSSEQPSAERRCLSHTAT